MFQLKFYCSQLFLTTISFLFCCSGLPHLAVSNSTPPPSTSPINIKVKSEPVSPPREQHHTSIMGHSHVPAGLTTSMNNASSNISVLSHPQTHLIMSTRPSSTGHLTPTPGKITDEDIFLNILPHCFCFQSIDCY